MMEPEKIPNNIERLKKALYSREYIPKEIKPKDFSGPKYFNVKDSWDGDKIGQNENINTSPNYDSGLSFAKKIFIGSVLFFVISIIVAVFVFSGSKNIVSADNIDINVGGPVSIGGGEELSLDISVVNGNTTALELADLIIEYPTGSRTAGNISKELRKVRENLGDIPAGKSAQKNIKAILFGEENSKQNIKIGVEYRVAGSNGIFLKEKNYEITIASAPVVLKVNSLSEINAGQEMEISVDVISNSPNIIKNVLLRAIYPFGWKFKDASVETASGNDLWKIGDMPAKSKKTITIHGSIDAQDGEERVIKFETGIAKDEDSKDFSAVFLSTTKSIAIKKPFLGVDLSLDGSSADPYVARRGRMVRADLVLTNNTSSNITDAEISLNFKGAVLDKSSVNVSQGFYRSIDNTIIWTSNLFNDLKTIEPGGIIRTSFSFSLLPYSRMPNETELSLDVSVKGVRVEEGNVPQNILAITRNVKIASDMNLSQKLYYWSGSIKNTGPIPPKVETETTYTVVWSISNSSNDLSGVKVSTVLPSYVKWMSQINPSTENISFNPNGGEVIWDVGNVVAGAGISKPKREITFQVSFLPSVSQLGTSPAIIGNTTITGTDSFTGTIIKDIKNGLTTRLNSEPMARDGDSLVQ